MSLRIRWVWLLVIGFPFLLGGCLENDCDPSFGFCLDSASFRHGDSTQLWGDDDDGQPGSEI